MSDDAAEADVAPARAGRHRAVLLAVGLAVITTAALLLLAPAVPGAARIGVALVAAVAGLALVAVALLPAVGAGWARPLFWALLAAGAASVAVVGDTGVRVPAILIGVLALVQCALGVVVWRRHRES